GKADITYNLTPQDNMALSHNSSVVVSPNYSTEIDYFVMTESGPLASPYARQAVSYAFNYDALINGFYHGFARRSSRLRETPHVMGRFGGETSKRVEIGRWGTCCTASQRRR
ncbi:MAG: Bacterial extracellular solute-binding protein family 5 Middle, partial [Chloroflexi bacterium]|nr:Bacterial extracellular solute-binding protein family 5 Middle [Chloroflexota bacterium]